MMLLRESQPQYWHCSISGRWSALLGSYSTTLKGAFGYTSANKVVDCCLIYSFEKKDGNTLQDDIQRSVMF